MDDDSKEVKKGGYIYWNKQVLKISKEYAGKIVKVKPTDKEHIFDVILNDNKREVTIKTSNDENLVPRRINENGIISVHHIPYHLQNSNFKNKDVWVRIKADEIKVYENVEETKQITRFKRIDKEIKQISPEIKEKTINTLKGLFLETYNDEKFRKENNIEAGITPSLRAVGKANPKFRNELAKAEGITTYNDILRDLGLGVNKDDTKYDKFKHDKDSNLLPKNARDQLIQDEFSRRCNDAKFRAHCNLDPGEPPTWRQFKDYNEDYSQFLRFTRSEGYKFNELVNNAGYEPNIGKWIKEFDIDEKGNQFSHDQSFNRMVNYYKEKIHTPEVEKAQGLRPKEGVSGNAAEKLKEGRGFQMALSKRGELYNDVVEAAGKVSHEFSETTRIGKYFHFIAERQLMDHLAAHNVKCYHETIFMGGVRKRTDVVMLIDRNAAQLSNDLKQLHDEGTKMLIFEFQVGANPKFIKEHMERGYQGNGRGLVIVSTHLDRVIRTPNDIQNSKAVKIMGPDDFTNFVKFTEVEKTKFTESVDLAKDALCQDKIAKTELSRLAKESKDYLKKNYPNESAKLVQEIRENPEFPPKLLEQVDCSHLNLDRLSDKLKVNCADIDGDKKHLEVDSLQNKEIDKLIGIKQEISGNVDHILDERAIDKRKESDHFGKISNEDTHSEQSSQQEQKQKEQKSDQNPEIKTV